MIRQATVDDAKAIAQIYNWYVKNTVIGFETAVVTVQEMAQRISDLVSDSLPWLVAERAGPRRSAPLDSPSPSGAGSAGDTHSN